MTMKGVFVFEGLEAILAHMSVHQWAALLRPPLFGIIEIWKSRTKVEHKNFAMTNCHLNRVMPLWNAKLNPMFWPGFQSKLKLLKGFPAFLGLSFLRKWVLKMCRCILALCLLKFRQRVQVKVLDPSSSKPSSIYSSYLCPKPLSLSSTSTEMTTSKTSFYNWLLECQRKEPSELQEFPKL